MSRVVIEDLCVTYPLFTRARGTLDAMSGSDGDQEIDPEATRLVRDAKGAVKGVSALQNVSFTVESGEKLGILGENGSGKTTLLQVLAGVYAPDSGVVRLEGRATSLVNINLGMRGEATGHRNITLRGLAAGRTRAEIEDKRAEIAAFSELGEFLDLPVETYSAGMRMRLNFAIATAFEPEILILDEWLSAGDAAFRQKATKRMSAFVQQAGVLILASHSRSLLKETCTRALWLDAGRVRADGPIETIMRDYEAEMKARQAARDNRAEGEIARATATKAAQQAALAQTAADPRAPRGVWGRLRRWLRR